MQGIQPKVISQISIKPLVYKAKARKIRQFVLLTLCALREKKCFTPGRKKYKERIKPQLFFNRL